MESLMSASNLNQNQDNSRRSSTPSASSSTPTTSSGGGFSSIFNLKSVISAATKTTHQQPQQQNSPVPTSSNTNFHMPQPITTLADQSSLMESHANSTNISQKPVQGRLNQLFCSVCSRLRFCGCNCS